MLPPGVGRTPRGNTCLVGTVAFVGRGQPSSIPDDEWWQVTERSRSPWQQSERSEHVAERLAALADSRTDDHTRALQARVVLEGMRHFAGLVDIDGTLLDINKRALDTTGLSRGQILGRPLWDTPWLQANPRAREQLRTLVDRAREGEATTDVILYRSALGVLHDIPVEVTFTPVRDARHGIVFLVVEAQNITSRRAAEAIIEAKNRQLAESEARFRALAENTSDLVCLHDPDGVYQYLSPSVRKLLGYEAAELVGAQPIERVHPEDRSFVQSALHAVGASGTPSQELSYRMRRRGGAYVWFESVITAIAGVDGNVIQLQSSSRDITERKRTEDELVRLAFHDELTGLPNRALLLDRISQALKVTRRTRQNVAVLFVDLDGFKAVNDTIGHYAGDATLVAVAERLTGMVRPGDTLARLGGDEFVMLCTCVDSTQAATTVASRVLHALKQPFTVYGRTIDLSASIGIAISAGKDEPLRLVENADTAMYEAKRAGRSRYSLFDPDERNSTLSKLATEFALRRAVERGELRLHYQPEIDLRTEKVVGFEALVRWQRDDGTLIQPSEFIPLAEETGLIVPIGRWVIEEACRQICRWERMRPDQQRPRVWVNLSARQLGEPDLVPTIEAAIRDCDISPESICLEITESALMQDAEAATAQLDQLRGLGISLGIDDFGTGYSSLAYLNRFPLDVLKIDRSFVAGLGVDPESETIVAAIIDLAHALDLTVIAEGVENDVQLAALRRLGCDQAVGFHFSRPRAPEDLTELILA